MNTSTIGISFDIIAGLGVFLFGMKNMSEGMQAVAGNKLRTMINAVTANRFMAVGMGTLITCLIQSSSITTVMAVGMVNAGVMNLVQAIGVIMGANIGTTITGWILVLKVDAYGLPIFGTAAFFYLFSKNERLRYTAMIFIGIGLIFFGLYEMKEGFKPLRDNAEFIEWFSKFQAHNYFGVLMCCLVGTILTAIVQSSSATLGITIGLASTGVIPFETAAALVLGQNVGTTITAYLASLGASTNAKRAAYAHIIFNVLGVVLVTTVFHFYLDVVLWAVNTALWLVSFVSDSFADINTGLVTGGNPAVVTKEYGIAVSACIAAAHTIFNVAYVILFLPLIPYLSALLIYLVPQKPAPEAPHLTYLDVRMLETPALGIEQSKQEVLRMGESLEKMLEHLQTCYNSPQRDEAIEAKIFHREELLDIFQKEVVEFLGGLLSGNVPHEVMDQARGQLRIADEYESIGDYIESILRLYIKLGKSDLALTPGAKKEIETIHRHVTEYLRLIKNAVEMDQPEILSKAMTRGETISFAVRDSRRAHMDRVERGEAPPLKSLIFTDMLNAYRRIKDHGLNVAEVVAGVK